jgi:hypothetical protein
MAARYTPALRWRILSAEAINANLRRKIQERPVITYERRSHISHSPRIRYSAWIEARCIQKTQKRDAYGVSEQYQKRFYDVKNISIILSQHQCNYHGVIPQNRK